MYKVMLVDDMEIFRRELKRLKVWNHTFVIEDEAVDGLDALKKLEANSMDLIFVDIRMPRMGGIELLQEISEKKLCPCVVLLSDYAEYGYARQGIVHGAFDYIPKSVTEAELKQLLERVEQYLDSRKKEEQKIAKFQEFIEDTYSSAIDIRYITQCICHGESIAATIIIEAADTIEENLCNDFNRALLLIKNTLQDILNETYSSYQWLPLYFNTNLINQINFINGKEWLEIRISIIKLLDELISVIQRFKPYHENATVKETCEYILMNVEQKLSIDTISEQMYINKAHLSEIFKQNVGLTLLEYITMTKMERAKMLLAEGGRQYYEIAYQLGYRDYEYFNKVFKKYVGTSWNAYAKQQTRERGL